MFSDWFQPSLVAEKKNIRSLCNHNGERFLRLSINFQLHLHCMRSQKAEKSLQTRVSEFLDHSLSSEKEKFLAIIKKKRSEISWINFKRSPNEKMNEPVFVLMRSGFEIKKKFGNLWFANFNAINLHSDRDLLAGPREN